MILGLAIGLLLGAIIAACLIGLFGANPMDELRSERWRATGLERENLRLRSELAQRGEVL